MQKTTKKRYYTKHTDAYQSDVKDAYSRLISAIVKLAIRDLVRGVRYEEKIKKKVAHRGRFTPAWKVNMMTAEQYLRSQWFEAMTGVDGGPIADRIRKDEAFREQLLKSAGKDEW